MRCCGATDFQDYGKLGMVVPATCYTIDKNFVQAPVSVYTILHNQYRLQIVIDINTTIRSLVGLRKSNQKFA